MLPLALGHYIWALIRSQVLYRTVSRMINDDSLAALAMVHIVQHFGWNTVVVVYSSDAQSVSVTNIIVEQCKNVGISILFALIIQPNTLQDTMQRIKDSNVRIVLAPVSLPDGPSVFQAVHAAGLDSSQFVWVGGSQVRRRRAIRTGRSSGLARPRCPPTSQRWSLRTCSGSGHTSTRPCQTCAMSRRPGRRYTHRTRTLRLAFQYVLRVASLRPRSSNASQKPVDIQFNVYDAVVFVSRPERSRINS